MTRIDGTAASPNWGMLDATATTNDPMLALAKLKLKSEQESQHDDDLTEQTARAAKQAANEQAVAKLHEAAQDIRTGATVSMLLSVGGGAMQLDGVRVGDKTKDGKLLDVVGKTAAQTADPAYKYIGEAGQTDANAASQAAKNRAESEQWVMEDCRKNREKSDKAIDADREAVKQLLDMRQQGMQHVLNRF